VPPTGTTAVGRSGIVIRASTPGGVRSPFTTRRSLRSCTHQACADAVVDEDPHAGLLVSLHVSGLRRAAYGRGPDSASRARPALDGSEDPCVTRFVAEEEGRQATLRRMLGLSELQAFHEHALLQVFDVLSLHLCLADLDAHRTRVLDRVATMRRSRVVDVDHAVGDCRITVLVRPRYLGGSERPDDRADDGVSCPPVPSG
jgi:hypothetical protein